MGCFHAEKMPHTVSALTSPIHSTASVAPCCSSAEAEQRLFRGFARCLEGASPIAAQPLPHFIQVSASWPPSLDCPLLNHTPTIILSSFNLICSFSTFHLLTCLYLFISLLPAYPLEGKIHGIRDFILLLTTSPVPGVDSGM